MTGDLGNPVDSAPGAYTWLLAALDGAGARYRLIDHSPEGRTELVSVLRGHPVAQAAKCLIVMAEDRQEADPVRPRRGARRRPPRPDGGQGAARRHLRRVRRHRQGGATRGSVTGTVLPFSTSPQLELIADPQLLVHDELFFNAGRLDRSVALASEDYRRIARPRLEPITAPPP